MKKILFFMTHSTLTLNHADICLKSLSLSCDPIYFDSMYIYNTHQNELSNETIHKMCESYKLYDFIEKIVDFPKDISGSKTLGSDIKNIFDFCKKMYDNEDHIFLLKSDCMISKNLLKEIGEIIKNKSQFIITPSFINAKARLSDEQILTYIKRETCVLSDDITFLIEGDALTPMKDERTNISPHSNSIQFISCTGKSDYSCHYLTVDLCSKVNIKNASWGGVNFDAVRDYWVEQKILS